MVVLSPLPKGAHHAWSFSPPSPKGRMRQRREPAVDKERLEREREKEDAARAKEEARAKAEEVDRAIEWICDRPAVKGGGMGALLFFCS
eukprot:gene13814-12272_t